MRIVDSNNLGNTTPAQTGRTAELHSIDASGKHGSALRTSSLSTDSVELSGFADRLSRTMQDSAASRAQRITQLTAAVRSGQYQVNAQAISHSMLSQALAESSSGKP